MATVLCSLSIFPFQALHTSSICLSASPSVCMGYGGIYYTILMALWLSLSLRSPRHNPSFLSLSSPLLFYPLALLLHRSTNQSSGTVGRFDQPLKVQEQLSIFSLRNSPFLSLLILHILPLGIDLTRFLTCYITYKTSTITTLNSSKKPHILSRSFCLSKRRFLSVSPSLSLSLCPSNVQGDISIFRSCAIALDMRRWRSACGRLMSNGPSPQRHWWRLVRHTTLLRWGA